MVHKLRFALPALALIATLVIVHPWSTGESHRTAAACNEREHEGEAAEREREREGEKEREGRAVNPMYAGPRIAGAHAAEGGGSAPCGDRPGHPESFADLAQANSAPQSVLSLLR